MTKFTRTLTLLAASTAGVFAAAPAVAAPVGATPPATANARIVRPLSLTANANLDFATIVMSTVTGPNTVSLTSGNVLTCGAGGELICSGTTTVANFTVRGTSNTTIRIFTAASSLTGSNGGTLTFTPAAAATVALVAAGPTTGASFNVGGAIVIDALTVDGVYSGNMDVTVDYN